jgi:hypothetical protein
MPDALGTDSSGSTSMISTFMLNPYTVGRLWGATYRVSLRSSAMVACSCIAAKENNPLLLRVFTGGMPHMKSKSVTDLIQFFSITESARFSFTESAPGAAHNFSRA